MALVDGVNTATPQTWYVATDHLHRPIRMTNAAKAVMWSATWTPWGAPHAITGAAVLDARFPGQWFQLESGLRYNWHRHYDPTLGRYTQPDPLGFVDGPSVYGYVGGSPQQLVDPEGLWSKQFRIIVELVRICVSIATEGKVGSRRPPAPPPPISRPHDDPKPIPVPPPGGPAPPPPPPPLPKQ